MTIEEEYFRIIQRQYGSGSGASAYDYRTLDDGEGVEEAEEDMNLIDVDVPTDDTILNNKIVEILTQFLDNNYSKNDVDNFVNNSISKLRESESGGLLENEILLQKILNNDDFKVAVRDWEQRIQDNPFYIGDIRNDNIDMIQEFFLDNPKYKFRKYAKENKQVLSYLNKQRRINRN